jgi:hypothetical protein
MFTVAAAPAIRFDRKVDGFAQLLKGGDKFQRCSAWKGRQSFFGYALGRLINEMIAWRQYPDRAHEALFSDFACFIVHGRNSGWDGWTTAVQAKDFRENREEIDPSKSNPSRFEWLGPGNHAEDNEELAKITPELRAHPDGLGIRPGDSRPGQEMGRLRGHRWYHHKTRPGQSGLPDWWFLGDSLCPDPLFAIVGS